MKTKQTTIITNADYNGALSSVAVLMSKSEKNLTAKEKDLLDDLSASIALYEEQEEMIPIPRTKQLAIENDREKIAAILGYEPDLIGLVEFKMYQLRINQNGLAAMLKMPASKISQILNKKRGPDVPFLKGLHEQLGIDGNYILETV